MIRVIRSCLRTQIRRMQLHVSCSACMLSGIHLWEFRWLIPPAVLACLQQIPAALQSTSGCVQLPPACASPLPPPRCFPPAPGSNCPGAWIAGCSPSPQRCGDCAPGEGQLVGVFFFFFFGIHIRNSR